MKVYSIKEVLNTYSKQCDGGELMLKHIICFRMVNVWVILTP